jgi:hypothetical protein
MKTFALILVWIFISTAIWLFATSLNIGNDKFKHLEFRFKSIFYWIAVIISFLLGYLI